MAKTPLSPNPTRTDLTDRECSKLLGSLIGGLCQMADVDTVRKAVRWWAETDEAWQIMPAIKDASDQVTRGFRRG